MAETSTALKNWFDRRAAILLADLVEPHTPGFERKRFLRRATRGLSKLEMMERVRQMSDALRKELPADTTDMLTVVTDSLPPVPTERGELLWPLGQLIADHGTDDFDTAMDAMIALTQRFTSEFAIRPFLLEEPELVLERLLGLTDHPSAHVRRWCSEGSRPRLPWGARAHALVKDPTPILPILEALKDDPEEYVRRSVANNLNDIAKDHPALVVKIAKRWWKGASPDRRRLVKHALRSLIKAGDPGALGILGYRKPTKLRAALAVSPKRTKIGSSVSLAVDLFNGSRRDQPLLVDYRVHYVKKRGEARPKVFKWKELRLSAGESTTLSKEHPMRVTSIRPLYPGKHRVELLVNGISVAEASFTLAV